LKSHGELDQTFDADLRPAQGHSRAVALIEHPGRQLAAKVSPLVGVDALQVFPASMRRYLQRFPKQRMPGIRDPGGPETVC
jgi:hypothetical protein